MRDRRAYFARPEVKARAAERARLYWQDPAFRAVQSVRSATRYAIKRGRLVKRPCEVCGEARVEAHHDDYSQPLNVRWLCRFHHREHHNRLRAQLAVAA